MPLHKKPLIGQWLINDDSKELLGKIVGFSDNHLGHFKNNNAKGNLCWYRNKFKQLPECIIWQFNTDNKGVITYNTKHSIFD